MRCLEIVREPLCSILFRNQETDDMAARKSETKLYVIDTNVLIHDPVAILNFEEHQVVIPMTVLEELDKFRLIQKKPLPE